MEGVFDLSLVRSSGCRCKLVIFFLVKRLTMQCCQPFSTFCAFYEVQCCRLFDALRVLVSLVVLQDLPPKGPP